MQDDKQTEALQTIDLDQLDLVTGGDGFFTRAGKWVADKAKQVGQTLDRIFGN
jgi:hypothetical protein